MAHVVVVGNDLGPDEAALKIRMDDARGLRGLPALVDGPGPHFVRPGGEITAQPQGGVARVDDARKPAFLNAVRGQHFSLLRRVQALQLLLQPGADAGKARAARLGQRLHFLGQGIALGGSPFVHIGAIYDGLGREQAQLPPGGKKALVFRQGEVPCGLALVKVGQQLLHMLGGRLGLLAALGHLLQLFQALFRALHVGQQQFQLNGFHIAQGVHVAVHMGDVFVLKAAHHLHDGRAFADIAQKLVAQPLALAGPAHQPGNVDKVHAGINGLARPGLGGEGVHPRVRHGHCGLVGFNGAERVVGGLGVLRLGQGVEQGGFAHVGQPNDSDAERHAVSLRCGGTRPAPV